MYKLIDWTLKGAIGVAFAVAIVLLPILIRAFRLIAIAIIGITIVSSFLFGFDRLELFMQRGAFALVLMILAEMLNRILVWLAPRGTAVIS